MGAKILKFDLRNIKDNEIIILYNNIADKNIAFTVFCYPLYRIFDIADEALTFIKD